MNIQHRLNKISLAVGLGLVAVTNTAVAQDDEIEEVVATGTRLQGSAAAVIEERRGQAFVADILGAEQLSRTGDSDAASALRRVTGLTLVDGKFIYVRGLGERYSSARLNGAAIPSPDLTRNVIPLDIFPATIIESMAVQKAYSPNMPAAFGGGNIDIRTKSVPTEFTSGFEIGVGHDSASKDGFTYDRPDGGMPSELQDAIVQYKGAFSLENIIVGNNLLAESAETRRNSAVAINNALLKTLPRDVSLEEESLDPAYNVKLHIGNSFETFGGDLGFMLAGAYDTNWKFSEKENGVFNAGADANSCSVQLDSAENIANTCYQTYKKSSVTTENERYNGFLNVGFKRDGHNVSFTSIYLVDNEDETEIGLREAPAASTTFTISQDGKADRTHDFTYEERELVVNQFVGTHTFNDYMGLGFDWQYTESEATTEIPVDISFDMEDRYNTSGEYLGSNITGDDERVSWSFTDMEDNVKSYGGNFSLPIFTSKYEIEFKAGYDFSDKARTYSTSKFVLNNDTNISLPVALKDGALKSGSFLQDDLIDGNLYLVDFNEPTGTSADDYMAGQKVDAGYGSFDVLYDAKWRVSGGIRYEEFKQVSLRSSSLIFNREQLNTIYSAENIQEGSINSDDTFTSLAFTYIGGDDYQIRASFGETVVRPDLREVVPVAYFDPLTDILTLGRAGLESSPIKNFDLRYEAYMANGDNLSVAAFYKDIDAPIESILRIGDEDYSASFVNGEVAEVYGVEVEWLHDLTWMADGFFTSGNVTFSDSEATIDPAFAANLTNTTKRMTGHSEYVVNLQLNYDSADGNHSGSLIYNVFGERILASGVGGVEDAMEQPFHSVDLVYTYYPDFNSKIKFKVKNLLDQDQEVTQSGVVVREKEVGVGFSLTYSYAFD